MKFMSWPHDTNFGDCINDWLWPRIMPELFENTKDNIEFIGIGTLLDIGHLKQAQNLSVYKVVFGSGCGYGPLPNIDQTWKIYFVRGRLTAHALGLPLDLATTDPALLLRDHFHSAPKITGKCSFVPHWQSVGSDWEEACHTAGIHYVNPLRPLEEVLNELSTSELVIAEAMHAAICSDAFRVPWIPVVTRIGINSFKWRDWCETLDIEYAPKTLPNLSMNAGRRNKLHRLLTAPTISKTAQALKQLINNEKPKLSSEAIAQTLDLRLKMKIKTICEDYRRGDIFIT